MRTRVGEDVATWRPTTEEATLDRGFFGHRETHSCLDPVALALAQDSVEAHHQIAARPSWDRSLHRPRDGVKDHEPGGGAFGQRGMSVRSMLSMRVTTPVCAGDGTTNATVTTETDASNAS